MDCDGTHSFEIPGRGLSPVDACEAAPSTAVNSGRTQPTTTSWGACEGLGGDGLGLLVCKRYF